MSLVEKRVENKIGYITLNRPEKRNALSHELVDELKIAFSEHEKDDMVCIIVLQAKGKAFCAGADLAYIQKLSTNTYEENLADSKHLKELFEIIRNLSKVVIAEVQGHAIAGGCGLASICDIVFAVPEALFGYSEVKIGFVPALVSVFLTSKVGETKAREMLLSAKMYTAEEAREMKLINEVVAADNLSETVKSFAGKMITKNSLQAMKMTKQLFTLNYGRSFDDAMEEMAKVNATARESSDCKRGIAAFLNKEELIWN